jgi:O-antigen ligase
VAFTGKGLSMIPLSKHHLNRVFVFLFSCLLIAQILYSEKPTEIDVTVLFHVGTLAIFLYYGLCQSLMHPDRFPFDRLILVALLFLAYFYTVGFFISKMNGVRFIGAIEFPYRIANLFIMLFIPLFVRRERDLRQIFAMILVMMGLQIIHDLVLGASTLFEDRLWSSELPSIIFLGSLPFAFGGLLLFWNSPRWRFTKRLLLMLLCGLVLLKVFLTFSRTVWLVLFPMNVVGVLYLVRRKSLFKGKLRNWYKRVNKFILSIVLISVLAAIGIVLYHPATETLIQGRYDITDQQSFHRMTELKIAFDQWLASPIWGNGFGFQTIILRDYHFRPQDYFHNFVMQFLVSSGIVGLALILALLGTTLIQLWRLFKTAQTLTQTSILISSLLTFFNICLISSVQTVILKQETYFFLGIIISFVIIIKRLQREEKLRTLSLVQLNEAPRLAWEQGIPLKLPQGLGTR